MWSKFLITDGTKAGTIDLLPRLKEWAFSMPQTKGGGYWSGSTYTQGRQLFNKQLDNIIDTFLLDIFTGKQITTIQWLNTLTTLLDKAVGYWTNDWQTEMVWIEMCPEYQDNSQYAIIMDWNIPGLDEIFTAPFAFSGGIEDINLIVEHGIWLENAPGVGTDIELQSANTDIEQTTAEKSIWVNNYWKNAPLTHLFVYDASIPAFSANQIGIDAVTLFPAAPAVGDILYVGRTSAAPGSPFDNLIWNIGTAQVGLTIVREIWTGAAWVAWPAAFSFEDDTDGGAQAFTLTGRNSMAFDPPWVATVWTPTAINGVTAYWIRWRITVVAGGAISPVTSESVYTNEWPYLDVPADQIAGTYSALLRLENWKRDLCNIDEDAVGIEALITKVLVGVRSISRGSSFIAYLPAYTSQLPAGFTFTIVAPAISQAGINVPAGNYCYWNPGAALTQGFCYWIIASPIAETYSGSYRVFLRGRETGIAGSIGIRLQFRMGGSSSPFYITDWVYGFTLKDEILDFGIVNISKSPTFDAYVSSIQIRVEGDCPAAGRTYSVYDLIMIPADEMIAEFTVSSGEDVTAADAKVLKLDTMLLGDSITYPKIHVQASNYSKYIDPAIARYFLSNWMAIMPGELFLNANSEDGQRLWYLAIYDENYEGLAEPNNRVVFHNLLTITGERQQRYISLRGDL